jgi:hypothetical protein
MDIEGWSHEELGELCDILANRMVMHIQGECAALLRVKKLEALVDANRSGSAEVYMELNHVNNQLIGLIDEKGRLEKELKEMRATIMDELSGMIPAQVNAEREACRRIAQKHVQCVGGVNHEALSIYNEIGDRR